MGARALAASAVVLLAVGGGIAVAAQDSEPEGFGDDAAIASALEDLSTSDVDPELVEWFASSVQGNDESENPAEPDPQGNLDAEAIFEAEHGALPQNLEGAPSEVPSSTSTLSPEQLSEYEDLVAVAIGKAEIVADHWAIYETQYAAAADSERSQILTQFIEEFEPELLEAKAAFDAAEAYLAEAAE